MIPSLRLIFTALFACASSASAHDLSDPQNPQPHYDRSVRPPMLLAQNTATPSRVQIGDRLVRTNRPAQAAAFDAFAPAVNVRWDERALFIESNGLPAHNMMVGITAWQQQVPLPQNYVGANAWAFPLTPVPARVPASIKNRFLRGAIAIAANGIPIFNPQNNRGEVSAEIGELDQWGGHCGRADDYHYHAAPLHLQAVLGPKLPIAYALDGYPIYGLTELDGSSPAGLDVFNGHTTAGLGYHYHASKKYPFVNGGFHGEVTEREGQVDPQPRANPVRPALPALRGAKITDFAITGENSRKLSYEVNGEPRAILYTINADGTYPFEFQNGPAGTVKEIYTVQQRADGKGGEERRRDKPPARAERPEGQGGPGPEPREKETPATIAMDDLKKPIPSFILTSPVVKDGGTLPRNYTGDGAGETPPLEWKGTPPGTKSFALVMDHLAPGNVVKWYWTLWDLPATTTSLPQNVKGVGKMGTSFKGALGYEPPKSQGPGPKTYVLTVYALSAPPQISQPPQAVTREVLLAALRGKVLASASLSVVNIRDGATSGGGPEPRGPAASASGNRPPREGGADRPPGDRPPREGEPPPPRGDVPSTPRGDAQPPARGAGASGGERRPPPVGAGAGLIKATMADTMKAEIYADNWFALYLNGRLTIVDPIAFLPHNVVSVDLLPEYPMTIAVIAHDNADPKTGLEYGNHIGDAGFILKFADGTVTDGTWKVKVLETGPIGRDLDHPRVETQPRPEKWFAPDFDDHSWENATVYTEERVNPKAPFYEHDFKGAQFIWSQDLDLDNTVLFRKRIEKPGWVSRWTAQPAGPLPEP